MIIQPFLFSFWPRMARIPASIRGLLGVILSLVGAVPARAAGLHRLPGKPWLEANFGFAELSSVGLFAMLFGVMLWLVRLWVARERHTRNALEVGGVIVGFFGASSMFFGELLLRLVGALGGIEASEPSGSFIRAAGLFAPVVLMAVFLALLTRSLGHDSPHGGAARWLGPRPGFSAATVAWVAFLVLLVAVPIACAWSLVWSRGESTAPGLRLGIEHLAASRYWRLGCLSGNGSCGSAVNSIALGAIVAALAALLGLALALYAHSTARRVRRAVAVIVCLPMITPPFLVGLGLSQVFGQAGFFSLLLESLFGIARSRWFFGAHGVVMAQVLAFFPISYFLVLSALDSLARGQIEAARFLGASRVDVLRGIAFPAIRDSLGVAFLVVFVEALSDIGNPLIVGGRLRVLSTELFYSSSAEIAAGEMTGVPALLLVVIALTMAWLKDRVGASGPFNGTVLPARERARCSLPLSLRGLLGAVVGVSFAVLVGAYAAIGIGAFSEGGIVSGAFTLENFTRGFGLRFDGAGFVFTGSAWNSLLASLACAVFVAPLSAFVGMSMVWIMQRGRLPSISLVERLSAYLLSVPSIVVGAGFLLAFGQLGLSTGAAWGLIVLAMMIRNLAVCMRFGGVALRRVDASFGELSGLFGASSLATFVRVIVPMLSSTFGVCVAYGFVRSMTMLGSVLLLSSTENQVATTYMIDRIGVGEFGVSMAYGVVLAGCIALVLGMGWFFAYLRGNAPNAGSLFGDLKAAVVLGQRNLRQSRH